MWVIVWAMVIRRGRVRARLALNFCRKSLIVLPQQFKNGNQKKLKENFYKFLKSQKKDLVDGVVDQKFKNFNVFMNKNLKFIGPKDNIATNLWELEQILKNWH